MVRMEQHVWKRRKQRASIINIACAHVLSLNEFHLPSGASRIATSRTALSLAQSILASIGSVTVTVVAGRSAETAGRRAIV